MQFENPDNTLVLVDGSSYLYRAFHAMAQSGLSNSKGEPTGAIYGVINMTRKILNDWKPVKMAVVFDAKGKTFRDDMYDQYKANRPPMPDELASQIEPIHQIIAAMGIPIIQVSGVEADDVIGTLASQASEAGMDVIVSTGDKDMAQLVNEHVTLINTMTDEHLDREGVKNKFGIPPELIIDYLALIGDKSDNVPGVEKVGPKTAVKWLEKYGDLDGVVSHAQEVGGKVGENLRAGLEQLSLSRKLVTIRCDLGTADGLDADFGQLIIGDVDAKALGEFYRRFEFTRWLRDLETIGEDGLPAKGESNNSRNYECVTSQEGLDKWIEKLESAECIAFDTETNSLDYMMAEVVGFSIAVSPGEAAYIPFAHNYPGAPDQLSREKVFARFKPILEDHDKCKVGHHLKYDRHVLANHGVDLQGIRFDTMLESYVYNSTATRHDMDSVALAYLDLRTIHFEEVAGKGASQITFDQVALEQAAPYAAEDADITLQLHHYFSEQFEQAPELKRVYEEIEIPLIPVLGRIERNGVLVDRQMLALQSDDLQKRIDELELKAHEEAGQSFNLGSPKQLQEILFDKMNLPVLQKTPKGAPSTAESALQELALDFELPSLILEHRSLAKLKSTYTDKLPGQIKDKTGRVHTSYHQANTATGRLSSSDPNLQNIPIRSEEGRKIRQAFIAPPGCKLVAMDYSQIELRIMAHLSGDEGLLKAFSEGQDIHRFTASEVFGMPFDRVSTEQRRSAKAINFGLIYGMSAFGLAKQLNIPRKAAQDYVNLYFSRYPGVKNYMETTVEKAKEKGYVETLFGRRLYLPEINARGQRRQYAERTAINAPMQGTAADIIKRAMISMDQYLQDKWQHEIKMIMQVHDELVFEVPEDALENFIDPAREIMEGAAQLDVPLIVDVGVGMNWDEAH